MTILKADDQAATRLLKAAVRKAREQIAEGRNDVVNVWSGDGRIVRTMPTYSRGAVVSMLAEAARSADLLLEER